MRRLRAYKVVVGHPAVPALPGGRHLPSPVLGSAEAPPVLPASRERLLEVTGSVRPTGAVVAAVEADPALVALVLRGANALPGRARTVGSVPAACAALGREALLALAQQVPVVDPLARPGRWGLLPLRLRAHGLAVRELAERLVGEATAGAGAGAGAGDVAAAALLHDVGKLALRRALADYPDLLDPAHTPEQRREDERTRLGADHAAAGGWLARRWRLPTSLVAVIEGHHDDGAGLTAIVRLADMLAHFRDGRPVDLTELDATRERAGVGRETLRTLLYELPQALSAPAPEPCQLSERELEVLRRLSAGELPKQAAAALGLSEKTVRNHLHRIYRRLGVADRTQAVLLAKEKRWL